MCVCVCQLVTNTAVYYLKHLPSASSAIVFFNTILLVGSIILGRKRALQFVKCLCRPGGTRIPQSKLSRRNFRSRKKKKDLGLPGVGKHCHHPPPVLFKVLKSWAEGGKHLRLKGMVHTKNEGKGEDVGNESPQLKCICYKVKENPLKNQKRKENSTRKV